MNKIKQELNVSPCKYYNNRLSSDNPIYLTMLQ